MKEKIAQAWEILSEQNKCKRQGNYGAVWLRKWNGEKNKGQISTLKTWQGWLSER